MSYALRVRLYHGDTLEADTDPDTPPGEPGAEIVQDLQSAQRAMVELCEAFHAAPGVRLLGFGADALRVYLAHAHSLVGRGSLSYSQGYSVLLDTSEVRSATMWRALVDISVSR